MFILFPIKALMLNNQTRINSVLTLANVNLYLIKLICEQLIYIFETFLFKPSITG